MVRRGEDKKLFAISVKFEFDYNGRYDKKCRRKNTEYGKRDMTKTPEIHSRIGFVRKRRTHFISTELGALEYMHGIEMRTQSVFKEEVNFKWNKFLDFITKI